MGQILSISHLGPITGTCEISIEKWNILTGPQSSGKSTIAKSVYFFRTISDDILDIALKATGSLDIVDSLIKHLRHKFLNLFGPTYHLPDTMKLCWGDEYNADYVKVSLRQNFNPDQRPNTIMITLSDSIRGLLRKWSDWVYPLGEAALANLKSELRALFGTLGDTVFIPAGRSTIALFTDPLYFMFQSMDEQQRRSLDLVTNKFIQLILRIRPWFADYRGETNKSSLLGAVQDLSSKILNANYRYVDSQERLYLSGRNEYVKINFASSGQQEAVWIINLLQYFLIEKKKGVFLIVEEPEAHLYPDSQMFMADILSLFINEKSGNHLGMITTHSPYVLGELNNLLLAGKIEKPNQDSARKILDKRTWIEAKQFQALHVHNGTCENAVSDFGLIKNELIDGASEEINERSDSLIALLPEDNT
ncbi:MAG: ATP-binding protein [Oscillospiraceae bacterium]|nr:ATP-binding protein [Oscillospiraceae bacterium]